VGLDAWFYSLNAAAVFRFRGGEHAEARKAKAGNWPPDKVLPKE
jgi:hypothetical protein